MKRLPALPSLYKPRAGLTQGLLTPAEWNASLLGDDWFDGLVVATAGVRLEIKSGVCSLKMGFIALNLTGHNMWE